MFDNLIDWALARAQEPSTVVGILCAAALLLNGEISVERANALATFVGLVASLVCVVTKERRNARPPS